MRSDPALDQTISTTQGHAAHEAGRHMAFPWALAGLDADERQIHQREYDERQARGEVGQMLQRQQQRQQQHQRRGEGGSDEGGARHLADRPEAGGQVALPRKSVRTRDDMMICTMMPLSVATMAMALMALPEDETSDSR